MALGFVARAMKAGLAKQGEPSLLRGADCGKAALQRATRLEPGIATMAEDNYVSVHDVAWIDAAFNPAVGDDFDHPDGTFTLDRLVSDNGYVAVFIVVPRA